MLLAHFNSFLVILRCAPPSHLCDFSLNFYFLLHSQGSRLQRQDTNMISCDPNSNTISRGLQLLLKNCSKFLFKHQSRDWEPQFLFSDIFNIDNCRRTPKLWNFRRSKKNWNYCVLETNKNITEWRQKYNTGLSVY